MDLTYYVHSVSTHPVNVTVHYEGQEITAPIPQLEVELTHLHGKSGSLLLHFRTAAEIAEAKELFTQGGTVMLSVTHHEHKAPPAVIDTAAEHEHAE
jgi:hypothetical protein